MNLYFFIFSVSFVLEAIASVLGIRLYKNNDRDYNLEVVISILLVSVAVKTFSHINYYVYTLSDHEYGVLNVLGLYNVYDSFVYLAWFFLFYRLISNSFRKLIPWFAFLFLASVLLEGVFLLNLGLVNMTYPHIIGSLLLSISVIFYFVQILQDGSFTLLKNNLYFWISSGLLIYYLGNLPFRMVKNFFTFDGKTEFLFFQLGATLDVGKMILFCFGLFTLLRKTND